MEIKRCRLLVRCGGSMLRGEMLKYGGGSSPVSPGFRACSSAPLQSSARKEPAQLDEDALASLQLLLPVYVCYVCSSTTSKNRMIAHVYSEKIPGAYKAFFVNIKPCGRPAQI